MRSCGLALLVLALALASPPVLGHGNVSLESDLCVISIGPYSAHFKIYLPRLRQHEEFCEDLPAAGESVFVMEYVHPALGTVPLDFRILRNPTGRGRFTRWEDLAAAGDVEDLTVFHHPAAMQRDVFAVLHTFDAEGDYLGLVTARHPETGEWHRALFPFEVGRGGAGWLPLFLVAAVVAQLAFLRLRRRTGRHAVVLAGLVTVFLGAGHALAGEETAWTSQGGKYRLAYTSDLQPLAINRMHNWVVSLQTADGMPVTGATLGVEGGMPQHNHGLPTRPRVTLELGEGRYRVEGLRFHMPGEWELRFTIDATAGRDIVVIAFQL